MIITLGSIKGAPGVTSWSVLLASAWPLAHAPSRIIVEADPDGGALAGRYGLGVEPGVVSLMAATRRPGSGLIAIEHHARALNQGLWVVPGPESREQARAVWGSGAGALADHLAADHRLWIVDVGRLDFGGPVAPLVERSALCVLVTNGHAEDLMRLPTSIDPLSERGVPVGVLVTGAMPYKVTEIVEFAGTPHVWHVARTEDLLAVAAGSLDRHRRFRRSWLWRSALDVAARMAEIVAASTMPAAAPANVQMRGAS